MERHNYYYHTAEGNAERNHEEEAVKKAPVAHGFDYKREHHVDLKCALPGATFASGDFSLVFGDTVVFLEVDEEQHESNGVSCVLLYVVDANRIPAISEDDEYDE